MRLSKSKIQYLVRKKKITSAQARRLENNPTQSRESLLDLGLTSFMIDTYLDPTSPNYNADAVESFRGFDGGESGGAGASISWDSGPSSDIGSSIGGD